MKGSVINRSTMWLHAMKRAVAPGGQIPLDELYDQYGKKHEIKKGNDFIEWLKNVKLKGNDNWQIVVDAKKASAKAKETAKDVEEKAKEIELIRIDLEKLDIKKMEIADVVSLSVRQARDVVPRISDVKLLKYSLQEAHPRAGKDSLCRILRKRINELETIRR